MLYRCTFPIKVGGVYVPGFGRFQIREDGLFDLPPEALPALANHGLHFEEVPEPTPTVVVQEVAEPTEDAAEEVITAPDAPAVPAPKRRGRPPKIRTEP